MAFVRVEADPDPVRVRAGWVTDWDIRALADQCIPDRVECRRQSTGQIAVIVTTLASFGLRLHGFGIKTTGLHLYGHLLASADSMAWASQLRQLPDLRRRMAGPHPGRHHVPRLPGQPVRPRAAGGGRMTPITAWRTDEPCPVCATGLILHDDGTSPPRAERRLCGWADTWTSDEVDGSDQ